MALSTFAPYLIHSLRQCRWCEYWTDAEQRCGNNVGPSVMKLLEPAYGTKLSLGRCEEADSLVRRSELFMSGRTRERNLRRQHFYQEIGDERRHIGCVELRWDEQRAPITSGFLKVPLNLLRDPTFYCPLLWYYSIYGGLVPYVCTPYTMHAPARGYLCAQAALHLSLVVMARHGAQILGPTTITAIARPRQDQSQTGGALLHDYQTEEDFDVGGLTVAQMEKVASQAKAEPHFQTVRVRDRLQQLGNVLARQLIEAYLSGGMPVIGLVHLGKLYADDFAYARRYRERFPGQDPPTVPSDRSTAEWKQWCHAILVIGSRRGTAADPQVARFVCHDTLVYPYLDLTAFALLKASAEFLEGKAVGLLALAPAGVKLTARQALSAAAHDRHLRPFRYPFLRIQFCEGALLQSRYFHRNHWRSGQHECAPAALTSFGNRRLWLVEQFASLSHQLGERPSRILGYDSEQAEPRLLLRIDSDQHGRMVSFWSEGKSQSYEIEFGSFTAW